MGPGLLWGSLILPSVSHSFWALTLHWAALLGQSPRMRVGFWVAPAPSRRPLGAACPAVIFHGGSMAGPGLTKHSQYSTSLGHLAQEAKVQPFCPTHMYILWLRTV